MWREREREGRIEKGKEEEEPKKGEEGGKKRKKRGDRSTRAVEKEEIEVNPVNG